MEIKKPDDKVGLHSYVQLVNAMNDVFKEIDQQKDSNTCIIPKGQALYRARMSDIDPENGSYCENATDEFEEFDAEKLNAPPLELVKEGRLNTKAVRYLYLANSEYCAASEVRPTIGHYVVIGTGNTIKELKCYSLKFVQKNGDPLLCLKNDFRKPRIDKKSYLVTQLIAQYIQSLEFDGIIFSSAQYAKGINYVLFNPENFVINSAKRYFLKNIEYSISRTPDSNSEILYPPNVNQEDFKKFFQEQF